MKLTPHDYQEESIQRVLSEPTKAALIGSAVGRGKTLIASEIVVRAGWKRVLFIVVGATFDQWEERLREQSDGEIKLRRLDSTKAGRAAHEDFLAGKDGVWAATIQWLQAQDWVYENAKDVEGLPIYKMDKKTGLVQVKERPDGEIGPASMPVRERMRTHRQIYRKMSSRKNGKLDAVIFDEAHQVSSRTSVGRRTLLTFDTDYKIALSATFSGNSFDNAWSLTRWCWPDQIPAYWAWREKWCKTETTYISGGRGVDDVVGEKNPGEFVRSLPLFIKDEADEQAPEALKIYCDSTAEQSRQFAELQADLLTWISGWDGDHEPLVVDIPAVLHSRLRQVALAALSFDENGEVAFAPDAPSGKLQALRGILDAWGEQPVVLFTDSARFARLTAARMRAAGYSVEEWTGDTSAKERQRLKKAFMAGEFQYFVMTVQAAGTGLDGLQTVCSKLVWLSEPDGNPTLAEQALGRLFRPGRTLEHGEFCHVRLLMRDSLDETVLSRLLEKAKFLHQSLSREALLGRAS